MPIQREIIYPIFLECCHYSDSTFWKAVFEDMAYGKTPYGTYITKGFFCCNYKDKEFSYKISSTINVEDLYNDIVKLLVTKLGFLSKTEKENKRMNFYNLEENIKKSNTEWSNIRKKTVKELLIERYVIDMKKKHFLSISQIKYLLSLIFIAIIFKIITSNDIVYENGKIIDIQGISISHKNINIQRDLYYTGSKTKIDDSINCKNKMSDNWLPYIENLRNLS